MLHLVAPSVARRLIGSIVVALIAAVLLTSPAAAADPDEWLLDADRSDLRESAEPIVLEPAPSPAPRPTTRPAPTPTPTPTPEPERVGIDVSYPQCGRDLPDAFDFAIVGVNGGRVYDLNPCLGPGRGERGQLAWAGRDAELYFNTGNPGPDLSRHWPDGGNEPYACATPESPDRDSLECAHNYGWNAAEHAYDAALRAYVRLGWADDDDERLPGEVTIWLDVEEANSWRSDRQRNVAALEGAVAYLESVGVERIGFYSTPRLWDRITGGSDAFAEYPAWHAGARDRADAERRCAEEEAFTGGELAMVQWVENGLDHNVRCDDLL